MDIGPKAHVVSQVPAIVVGIFVDHDVVTVPVPAVAEANVVGSHAEIEAAEPKTAGATSRKMPDVSTAKTAGKATVLKGMVQMVVRIVAARVVANPFSVGVNVGSIGMPSLVVEMTILLWSMRRAHRRWTVRGDMPTRRTVFPTLRPSGERKQ